MGTTLCPNQWFRRGTPIPPLLRLLTQPLSSLSDEVELLLCLLSWESESNSGGGAKLGRDSLKPLVFGSLLVVLLLLVVPSRRKGTLLELSIWSFCIMSLSELLDSFRN